MIIGHVIERRLSYLLSKLYEHRKIIIISVLSFIFIGCLVFSLIYYKTNHVTIYHVYVDDEKIGVINNKEIIDRWISQNLQKAQTIYGPINLDYKNDIKYVEESVYKGTYDNYATLRKLNDDLVLEAKGINLVVNDKVIGVIKDINSYENIINSFKESYIANEQKEKIIASTFSEREKYVEIQEVNIKGISLEDSRVLPEEIMNEDQMLNILMSSIPNSNLDSLLTIETLEVLTQIEKIPYKIVYKDESSMFVNEAELITEGKEGKIEVKYQLLKENGNIIEKKVISQKVIEEPIAKTILIGTKEIPSRGSGILDWPVDGGVISSYFGMRWGVHHNGVDIVGTNDYNIKSVDDGVVVFTGWKSGYGNTIIINHKNGIQTLYAHLNYILVDEGEKVNRGEKIGVMGNTGRSTGTHLHFEVRINDEYKNPLNYIGI